MSEHDLIPSQEQRDAFSDLNRLMHITRNMDERGLVLAFSAFAEDALGDLLIAFMRPGEATKSLVSGFNAPLGTFSSRIKAAVALGLITENQYSDLERLRKIRNEFAHTWDDISFDKQNISAHIAAINYSFLMTDFPETKVDKLRISISSLLTELRVSTEQIAKKGASVKVIGSHLIPGIAVGSSNEIEMCEERLSEIASELPSSVGERVNFLRAQYERWHSLLILMQIGSSGVRRTEILQLLSKYPLPPK